MPIRGEYSAKKINYFPSRQKYCEKLSPYFSLSEVENFSKLHFFGKKLSRLAFLGGKLKNFTNLGVKIEKNRVKNIKICTFRVKSFPQLLFFPHPPFFYLAEYSPMHVSKE